jgi:hypothetical protein
LSSLPLADKVQSTLDKPQSLVFLNLWHYNEFGHELNFCQFGMKESYLSSGYTSYSHIFDDMKYRIEYFFIIQISNNFNMFFTKNKTALKMVDKQTKETQCSCRDT